MLPHGIVYLRHINWGGGIVMPNMWVDFYQVIMPPNAGTDFAGLLHRAFNAGNDRVQSKRPNAYFLDEVRTDGDISFGLMVKVRMEDVPVGARLDGSKRDLPLHEDEGVGEETSMLYSHRHGILLLQRNGNGTRATTLLWYLEAVTRLQPVELRPVIGEDAMRKLQRMSLVRRFEVALAKGDNTAQLRGRGLSINRMVDLIDQHAAARISVNLGMGDQPRGRSMNVGSILDTARSLLSLRGDDESKVTKLVVTGKEDTDEPQEPLDLLLNRMNQRIPVERVGRRVPAASCRDALREAFRIRENELTRLFPPRINE